MKKDEKILRPAAGCLTRSIHPKWPRLSLHTWRCTIPLARMSSLCVFRALDSRIAKWLSACGLLQTYVQSFQPRVFINLFRSVVRSDLLEGQQSPGSRRSAENYERI